MSAVAFKQCDVERALRAAKRAETPVVLRIERATGDIIVSPAPLTPSAANEPMSALDQARAERAKRAAQGA